MAVAGFLSRVNGNAIPGRVGAALAAQIEQQLMRERSQRWTGCAWRPN